MDEGLEAVRDLVGLCKDPFPGLQLSSVTPRAKRFDFEDA